MYAVFRAIVLGTAVFVGSAGVALAAQVDVKPPGTAELNVTKVSLANGQSIYCRKAGGEQEVFTLDRAGKHVPLPPGSYKQKNGHVFVVGIRGIVRPGSTVMLNPQPLPP